MRRLPLLILIVSLFAAAAALAATRDDHQFSMKFTKSTTSTSTGVSFGSDRFTYVAPPAGQTPLHVTKTVFTMAPGTRTNTKAVPACTMAKLTTPTGKEDCAKSKVGSGSAVAITGITALDPVKETVTVFAGKNSLFAYLEGAQTTIIDLKLKGNKLTAEVPRMCVPGGTLADNCKNGDIILKTLDVKLNAKKKGKRVFIKTPATCPSSRKWTNKAVYTFDNGDSETKTSTTPCRK